MDKLRITTPWVKEFLSEFMGTFILMTVGLSSMSHFVLKQQHDLFAVVWCWGVAVMLGMLTGAKNSGGHVNPMVTVSLASVGKLDWAKVPHYLAGQFLGSFIACGPLYVNNKELLDHFDGGKRQLLQGNATGILWTTFPDPNVSMSTCVLDTIICCAVIMFCILAILDETNANIPGFLHSFYVALLVLTVVWTMGSNCMCAINPARDFSPRIFAAMVGYGEAFSHRGFWWIPLVVPLIGGVLGSWLYQLTIGIHTPKGRAGDQSTEMADLKIANFSSKEIPAATP